VIDFQIVFPTEIIPLISVRQTVSSGPRTLDITGADFRSVDEVLVNGIESPSVVVVSANRLLAVVPPAVAAQYVDSVQVVSRRITLSRRSLIRFRIGKQPSKVRGVLRLVQLFLKILLTTPGTDIFDKKLGGGVLKNIGATFGRNQRGAIISDFVIAVDTAVRQIVAVQSKDASIPLDERLLSARIISSQFDVNELALSVSIELVSQAGSSAVANVLA